MFNHNQMTQITKDIYHTCNTPDVSNRITREKADQYFSRFDKNLLTDSPLLFYATCVELAKLIPADIEILAGFETASIQIAEMLSWCTGLPLLMLPERMAIDSFTARMEGLSVFERNVLVVDDVYGDDDGESVMQAARFLRHQGANVGHALALLDRSNGAAFNFFNNDVDGLSLFEKVEACDLEAQ